MPPGPFLEEDGPVAAGPGSAGAAAPVRDTGAGQAREVEGATRLRGPKVCAISILP